MKISLIIDILLVIISSVQATYWFYSNSIDLFIGWTISFIVWTVILIIDINDNFPNNNIFKYS